VLSNLNNVKKGDVILTEFGSGVLIRETRARWFYLFKGKILSMSKSVFWHSIDMGYMKVSYVESKKYRTKQKRFRTLDLRQKTLEDAEFIFHKFIDFVKTPFNIVLNYEEGLDFHSLTSQLEKYGYAFTWEKIGDRTIIKVKQ
tara:strand:- start:343 stop:771 length:429 start_codon:yes stop_codon:yes gene_type:complete